jgi:hypothetical protein
MLVNLHVCKELMHVISSNKQILTIQLICFELGNSCLDTLDFAVCEVTKLQLTKTNHHHQNKLI